MSNHREYDSDLDNLPAHLIVSSLIESAFGKRPLSWGEAIVHPDITLHMDQWTFVGRRRWRMFARYLRTKKQSHGMEFILDRAVEKGNLIVCSGRLILANQKGSNTVHATFRFQDKQVMEIWTHRSNYTIILGASFNTVPGFMWILLKILWWNRRYPLAD